MNRAPSKNPSKFGFLDFFAGSGLVSHAVSRHFETIWANDHCPKKAKIYQANHGDGHFHLADIRTISGKDLPAADVSWASFPCQDLSLAGAMRGLSSSRSGLFWEWLRVLDEMPTPPGVIALENVLGLVASEGGAQYRELHRALLERGYAVGAVVLDAVRWVPQSRPRVFVVGVLGGPPPELVDSGANWLHPTSVRRAMDPLADAVWWHMPEPPARTSALIDLLDLSAPCHAPVIAEKNLGLVPENHQRILDSVPAGKRVAFPGYRRTRGGKQVLELRFDGVAGCLRTPEGGSSRQFLVIRDGKGWKTRLFTAREAARLMGAPESFQLSENYNESYGAMGDAVAVPPVGFLTEHILAPLVSSLHQTRRGNRKRPNKLLQSA